MKLKRLDLDFTVCKICNIDEVDFTNEFVFISKTDEEISLVCDSSVTPHNAIAIEAGWKALKFTDNLDFGMVGVIAKVSNILSMASISIFVVSTYNTDYVFLKSSDFEKSISLLENSGYIIS